MSRRVHTGKLRKGRIRVGQFIDVGVSTTFQSTSCSGVLLSHVASVGIDVFRRAIINWGFFVYSELWVVKH